MGHHTVILFSAGKELIRDLLAKVDEQLKQRKRGKRR